MPSAGPELPSWARTLAAVRLSIWHAGLAACAFRPRWNDLNIRRTLSVFLLLYLLSAAFLAKTVHDRQAALSIKSHYNIIWAATRMSADLNRFAQAVAEQAMEGSEENRTQVALRAEIVNNRLAVMSNGEFAEFTTAVPAQRLTLDQITKQFSQLRSSVAGARFDAAAARDLLDDLGEIQSKVGALVSAARAYSGDREQFENREVVRLHLIFLAIVAGLIVFGLATLFAVNRQFLIIKKSNTKLEEVARDLRLTTVSRQHLDAAINNMSHALCLIDSDDNVIIWNSQFLRMFAIAPNSRLENVPLFRLLGDQNRECGPGAVPDGMLEAMRAERGERSASHLIQEFEDGRAIAIAQRRFKGGWVVTFEDITQRRQQEQDKLRAIADAEQARGRELAAQAASRAKSSFLASMSHEIRTPMNGVFGMTDLLMRTELTERQQRLVNTINQSAKSLLAIINDVLDVSRIEAGKLVLDISEFDLRKSLEDTIDLLAETAQKKGLELTLLVAPEVPRRVVGDVGRIRQICTNLIGNAVKFTENGNVAVSVSCQERSAGRAQIGIVVRDTGIGIAPDVQKRLFQPFEQADTSIARRFGGTGLGLTITKHLIEKMGGSITLQSEAGVGSEFTISLPLETHADAWETAAQMPISLDGARILVLDPRVENRQIVASYLSEAGADVTSLDSPETALEALRASQGTARPFAIAFIDLVQSSCSGLDVVDRIRSDAALAELQLIMVTSLSWKGDVRMGHDQGFQAFVTKPVHRGELLKSAAAVLTRAERVETASSVRPIESRRGSLNGNTGVRVLIAEDNPVNVEVAKEFIASLDWSSIVACNGAEAVAAFSQTSFDVVLMDCKMPEMDGLMATRHIRRLEEARGLARTPIVALTASAFEEDRTQCLDAGMDDFLSKPFTEEQFQQVLLAWVQRPGSEESDEPEPMSAGRLGSQCVRSNPIEQGDRAGRSRQHAGAEPSPLAPAVGLDHEMLKALRSGHPKLFTRLIDTYVRFAPELLSQLLAAAAAVDREAMRSAAHSLKSSSGNVGATRLAGHCRDLEQLLRSSAPADAGAWQPIVDEIERDIKSVLGDLHALAGRGVESQRGVATTAAATQRHGEGKQVDQGISRSAHVLVAEDNPVNVEIAKEFVRSLGWSFRLAGNGLEAVAAFSESRFDVILMDCQMPEMDGLTATRRIRDCEKALGRVCTPIIAVTANAFEEDKSRCFAAGMDDFLSKPYTEEQFHQILLKWTLRSEVSRSSVGTVAA